MQRAQVVVVHGQNHGAVAVAVYRCHAVSERRGRVAQLIPPSTIAGHGGGQLAFVYRLAGPVAGHGQVEQQKKRLLKLFGAASAAGNVDFVELSTIDKPLDEG